MPLPLLPLLLGIGAVTALALSGKKDGQTPAGAPGTPGGALPPGVTNPFDRGLTAQQVVAVQTALATEQDPDKLDAFAKSLLPEFPIAASALSSRAIVLRVAHAANVPPPAAVPVVPLPLPNLGGQAPVFPLPPPPPPPPFSPAAASFDLGSFPRQATVTTHDTGPSGALAVRPSPSTAGAPIGSNPHGAPITVMGPAVNGFYPVSGPGGTGFSSADFITLGSSGVSSPLLTPVSFPGAPQAPAGIAFPNPGSHAIIATKDTGPAGNLNLRASAPSGAVIGSNAHGATVTITGPLQSGFYPITGPGGSGFSSAQFLAAAPTTFSAGFAGNGARVITTANLLGLRGSPDPRAPYIAQAPKNSQFTIAGPERAGYVPLRDDAGRVAWASTMYVKSLGTVAGNDIAVGPSTPFAELHMTALALKTALATHGCRSYNEPLVKDFQRVAKRAGIYTGDIDGWYGTVTQAALSKIVGKPAPACFAEATGGPSNPNEYWSPMGV